MPQTLKHRTKPIGGGFGKFYSITRPTNRMVLAMKLTNAGAATPDTTISGVSGKRVPEKPVYTFSHQILQKQVGTNTNEDILIQVPSLRNSMMGFNNDDNT